MPVVESLRSIGACPAALAGQPHGCQVRASRVRSRQFRTRHPGCDRRPASGLPRALYALADHGVATVSSEELAAAAGVNSAKLRKDLSHLGSYGTRGVGYDVDYLVYQVSRELGLTQDWPVLIVGAGNLGHALANYGGFASRGFRIAALVDCDPAVVGTVIARHTVRSDAEIEDVIDQFDVSIGVIATPAAAAQNVCDRLVAAGVTSILNFAPVVLNVPSGVDVRKVDLSIELQILAFHAQRRSADGRPRSMAPGGGHGWPAAGERHGWDWAWPSPRSRAGTRTDIAAGWRPRTCRRERADGGLPESGYTARPDIPNRSAGGRHMSVLVVGLSHKGAPLATLEQVALAGDALDKLLHDVVQGRRRRWRAGPEYLQPDRDLRRGRQVPWRGRRHLRPAVPPLARARTPSSRRACTCTTRTGRCSTC